MSASLKVYKNKHTLRWFLNESKITTKQRNVFEPGYVKIRELIPDAWQDTSTNVLVESFKCCGTSSINNEDYNSQLRTILVENIIPLNTSIGIRNEIDTFNKWFRSDSNYNDDNNKVELELGDCGF